LENLGLKVHTPVDHDTNGCRLIGQKPQAGARVARGSVVQLSVRCSKPSS
jgi:beta-lactam-binding protein with PASTA domain